MVWQRARSDEQKEQRRQTLLEAAARLHAVRPIEEISLNAIAREANMSKAGVYRYFESREELFLELTLESMLRWRTTLLNRLEDAAGSEDEEKLARALATAIIDTPRFARLASVLATVLERNVSADTVARLKTSFLIEVMPVVEAVAKVFPNWTQEEAQHFLRFRTSSA